MVNGTVDQRSPARPKGFDATGPQDNSTFHIYPSLSLSAGDVLEARWTDRAGSAWTNRHVVGTAGGTR